MVLFLFPSPSRCWLASSPEELIDKLNLLYDPLKGPVRINLLLCNGNQVGCYFVAQQTPHVQHCSADDFTLAQDAALIMDRAHPHPRAPSHCGYQSITSYCQFPLSTARGQLGAVEFFSDLEKHFCASILARLHPRQPSSP